MCAVSLCKWGKVNNSINSIYMKILKISSRGCRGESSLIFNQMKALVKISRDICYIDAVFDKCDNQMKEENSIPSFWENFFFEFFNKIESERVLLSLHTASQSKK